jgi:surface protein
MRNIEASKLAPRRLSYSPFPAAAEWVRNKAWPTLVEPSNSEQKLVGLYAVFPGDGTGTGGNWFAVTFAGAYTVNFGDGTSVNTTSGTQTNKSYNFNDSDLYDATVTFTDAGDLVTRNNHGYVNGDIVSFYRISSTTGISEGQIYYVINATQNTFQISQTSGGSAIGLTTDGSASLLPYKIATVTITPQTGQNLTSVNLAVKHNQTGLQNYTTGWLDIALSVPSATSITLGTNTILNGNLERFNLIAAGDFTSCLNWFNGNRKLREVIIPFSATAAVTTIRSMFQSCSSLTSVPLFNTAAVTTMQGMFNSCSSLTSVPLFNTAAVANMNSMFFSCSSLTSVPLFNTAAVTDMSSMFNSCSSLTSVPLFNTAAVTNMSSMFNSCSSLTSVPALVVTAVSSSTSLNSMFNSCSSLSRIEAKDFRFTFSVANCNFSSAALNEIYTNLPTVVGQTITVSGNYGTTGDVPTIATAKGWAVTG